MPTQSQPPPENITTGFGTLRTSEAVMEEYDRIRNADPAPPEIIAKAQALVNRAKVMLCSGSKGRAGTIYGNWLLGHRIVVTDGTNGCEFAQSDGFTIEVNANFIFSKAVGTVERTMGLLVHERLHDMSRDQIRREALFRAAGVDAEYATPQGLYRARLYNQAADHVINLMCCEDGLELPLGGLADPRFRGLSREQVYKTLLRENPPPPDQPDRDPEQGQGQGEEQKAGQPQPQPPQEGEDGGDGGDKEDQSGENSQQGQGQGEGQGEGDASPDQPCSGTQSGENSQGGDEGRGSGSDSGSDSPDKEGDSPDKEGDSPDKEGDSPDKEGEPGERDSGGFGDDLVNPGSITPKEIRDEILGKGKGDGKENDNHQEPGQGRDRRSTPPPMTNEEKKEYEDRVRDQLIQTALNVGSSNSSAGGDPRGIERMFDELKVFSGAVDARAILQRFIQTQVVENDYTYSRLDETFLNLDEEFYVPVLEGEQCGKLALAFDTSGSISDAMIHAELGFCLDIIREVGGAVQDTPVLFCDHILRKVDLINDGDPMPKPAGGRATKFAPVMEWVKENVDKHELVGLVYLTDGRCSPDHFGPDPGVPVLWVLAGQYKWPVRTFEKLIPFGEVVDVDEILSNQSRMRDVV